MLNLTSQAQRILAALLEHPALAAEVSHLLREATVAGPWEDNPEEEIWRRYHPHAGLPVVTVSRAFASKQYRWTYNHHNDCLRDKGYTLDVPTTETPL